MPPPGWAEASAASVVTGLSSWGTRSLRPEWKDRRESSPWPRRFTARAIERTDSAPRARFGSGWRAASTSSAISARGIGESPGLLAFSAAGASWSGSIFPQPLRRRSCVAIGCCSTPRRADPQRLPRRLSSAQANQPLAQGAGDPEGRRGNSGRCTVRTSPGPTSGSAACSTRSTRAANAIGRSWSSPRCSAKISARDASERATAVSVAKILEVPLVVALPASSARRIAAAPKRPVALTRIWATVAEAAGLAVPPAVAPSLFRSSERRSFPISMAGRTDVPTASRCLPGRTSCSGKSRSPPRMRPRPREKRRLPRHRRSTAAAARAPVRSSICCVLGAGRQPPRRRSATRRKRALAEALERAWS